MNEEKKIIRGSRDEMKQKEGDNERHVEKREEDSSVRGGQEEGEHIKGDDQIMLL